MSGATEIDWSRFARDPHYRKAVAKCIAVYEGEYSTFSEGEGIRTETYSTPYGGKLTKILLGTDFTLVYSDGFGVVGVFGTSIFYSPKTDIAVLILYDLIPFHPHTIHIYRLKK